MLLVFWERFPKTVRGSPATVLWGEGTAEIACKRRRGGVRYLLWGEPGLFFEDFLAEAAGEGSGA